MSGRSWLFRSRCGNDGLRPRQDSDVSLTGDNVEVSTVGCDHVAAVLLRTCDYRCIGESQRKIRIPLSKLVDAWKAVLAAIQGIRACRKILKESRQGGQAEVTLDKVSDLGKYAGGDKIRSGVRVPGCETGSVMWVCSVEDREQCRGVEREHYRAGCQ